METSPGRTSRSGEHARSGPLLRARDAEAAPPQHRAPVATSRQGTRARPGGPGRVPLAAGAAVVVVLLVGGASLLLDGDDAAPAASPTGSSASASAPASPAPGATPSARPSLSSAVVAATGTARTAADARAALEEQLAARAEANLAMLRSTWTGDESRAAEAAEAVAASSRGLSAVVTTWRDADLAGQITTGLDEQSNASRAYAAGVGAGDLAAADEARGRMGEVSRALGDVLDDVTGGRIADYVPPQDAAQYRAFVDALEAQDAVAAEEAAAWLRGRLSREGTALASALAEGGPA